MTSKFETLQQAVLEKSVATTWKPATREWSLARIYRKKDGTCVCGKTPIVNHCVITNHDTKQQLTIGTSCLEHFTGDLKADAMRVHAALKKLIDDPDILTIPALIEMYRDKLGRGADMYLDCLNRKRLSEKQLSWIRSMNRIIVKAAI